MLPTHPSGLCLLERRGLRKIFHPGTKAARDGETNAPPSERESRRSISQTNAVELPSSLRAATRGPVNLSYKIIRNRCSSFTWRTSFPERKSQLAKRLYFCSGLSDECEGRQRRHFDCQHQRGSSEDAGATLAGAACRRASAVHRAEPTASHRGLNCSFFTEESPVPFPNDLISALDSCGYSDPTTYPWKRRSARTHQCPPFAGWAQVVRPDFHSPTFPWRADRGSARGLPVQELHQFGGSETLWPHCHH